MSPLCRLRADFLSSSSRSSSVCTSARRDRRKGALFLDAPEVGVGRAVAVKTPVSCTDEVVAAVLDTRDCEDTREELPGAATASGDQMPLLTMPCPRLIALLSSCVQVLRVSRIQQNKAGSIVALLVRDEESARPSDL